MLSSILGTLAATGSLVITFGLIDQAIINHRRKSCEGVSPTLVYIAFITYLLWVLYGWSILNFFLIIAETPGLIVCGVLAYQIHRYGPRPSPTKLWQKVFKNLKPDLIVERVDNIDFVKLAHYGAVNLIIDVDNTLVLPRREKVDNRMLQHLENARIRGLVRDITLVSNVVFRSHKRHARVKRIARLVRAHGYLCAVHPHTKPHPLPIIRSMAALPHANERNTWVIGDQLFTDCLAAKRAGLKFILVKPLGPDHGLYTSWKRPLERLVFRLTQWR